MLSAMAVTIFLMSVPFDICRAVDTDVECARQEVKRMVETEPGSRAVSVRISVEDLPPIFLATTGAGRDAYGREFCIIHIQPTALTDMEVLSHESCHCIQDRSVLELDYYRKSVTPDEAKRRELNADACAVEMLKMTERPDWGLNTGGTSEEGSSQYRYRAGTVRAGSASTAVGAAGVGAVRGGGSPERGADHHDDEAAVGEPAVGGADCRDDGDGGDDVSLRSLLCWADRRAGSAAASGQRP